MTRVVLEVGRGLIEENVMFLLDIHNSFNCHAWELASQYLQEDISVAKLVTSAYILSSLTAIYLQHHVTYSCPVKKVRYSYIQSKF